MQQVRMDILLSAGSEDAFRKMQREYIALMKLLLAQVNITWYMECDSYYVLGLRHLPDELELGTGAEQQFDLLKCRLARFQ